jgi:hypothetical protein
METVKSNKTESREVCIDKEALLAEKDAIIAKERAEKEVLLAKIAALEAKSNTGKGINSTQMETVRSNKTESWSVRIANPIYDYAFLYLLDDNEIARKFLSTIIGEEVIEFTPFKQVCEKIYFVCHFALTARIRSNEEVKTVIIEVQKIFQALDAVWFKSYLEGQYQTYMQKLEESVKESSDEAVMPIYCIFVLGNGTGIKGVPVVKVNDTVVDNVNGEELSKESKDIVKNLHHRSWIIQISELTNQRNSDVDVLLSIFDQTNRVKGNRLFLDIEKDNYPEEYHPIIRRLARAAVNENLCKVMQDEDYLVIHERKQRAIIAEKDAAIAEKDAILAKKDAILAEKDAILAEIAALEAKSNTGK